MNRCWTRSLWVAALLTTAGACPFESPPDDGLPGDAGDGDARDAGAGDTALGTDSAAADHGRADVGQAADATASSDAASPTNCHLLKEQLKQELGIVGSCTVVVRQQPYGDNLRFQVVCGEYRMTGESQARATAELETGLATTAALLNTTTPADEFVFYDTPDTQGGVAAVSVRTGRVVFGATLDNENRSGNAITHPVSWRPAAALGPGCRSSHTVETSLISAYDLAQGVAITMPEEWALIAAARLSDTVLIDAMAESGYVFDLVALYYVALGFGPGDEAENVLLLNGGWLE
jgi:hypothetical protein